MALVTQNILEDAKKKKATTTTTTNKMTPGISGLKQTKAAPATGVTPKVNTTVTKSIEKSASAKPTSAKQTKHVAVNKTSNAVTNVLNKVKESQGKPIPNTGLTPNKGYTERLKDLRPQEETSQELKSVTEQLNKNYKINPYSALYDPNTQALEKRRQELMNEEKLQSEKKDLVTIPEYQKAYEEALAKGDKEEANRINEVIDALDDSTLERVGKSFSAAGRNAFADIMGSVEELKDISYEKDALGYEEQYKRALAEGKTEEAEYYRQRAEESRKRADSYDALDESHWSVQLRNESQKIMELERIGASGTDMLLMETGDNIANMLPTVAASAIPGVGSFSMAVFVPQVFSSVYANNMKNGYDIQTSASNAALSAAVEFVSEEIGTITGFAIKNTPLNNVFSRVMDTSVGRMWGAMMANSIIQDPISEGNEELFSGLVQPIIDHYTLGTDIEYSFGDLSHAWIMGALTSAIMNTPQMISTHISSSRQANFLKAEMEMIDEAMPEGYEQANSIARRIAENALAEFREKSITADAIKLESEQAEVPSVNELLVQYAEFMKPTEDAYQRKLQESVARLNEYEQARLDEKGINLNSGVWAMLDSQTKQDIESFAEKKLDIDYADYITHDTNYRKAMVEVAENGYKGLDGKAFDAGQYMNLTEAKKQNLKSIQPFVNSTQMNLNIGRLAPGVGGYIASDNTTLRLNPEDTRVIEPNKLADLNESSFAEVENILAEYGDKIENDTLTDKEREDIQNRLRPVFMEAGQDADIYTTAIHETGHYTESTGTWNVLRDQVKAEMGEERFNRAVERLGEVYKALGVKNANAEHEVVTHYLQANVSDPDFLSKMARYNQSSFYRLYNNLSSMLKGDAKSQIENTFMRAVRNANNAMDAELGVQYSAGLRQDGSRKDLRAVHNLSEDKLRKALELGSFVMPSIAVSKDNIAHEGYGDISIVFDESTVNPANSKNKVYKRDAWTPTFPQPEVEVDYDSAYKLGKKVKDLTNDVFGYSALDKDNIANSLDRHDGDPVEAYKNHYNLKLAYAKENGFEFDVPTKESNLGKRSSLTNQDIIDVYNLVGKDFINEWNEKGSYETFKERKDIVNKVKDHLIEAYNERFEKSHDGKSPVLKNGNTIGELVFGKLSEDYATFDSLMNGVLKYGVDEKIPTEVDTDRFKEIVDSSINQKDYENWLREQFKDVIKGKGIRNDKDPFTPNGNRRTFKQTHDPYTAETVLKNMLGQRETATGGWGNGFGGILATYLGDFKNVKDMIAEEDRLSTFGESEDEAYTAVSNEWAELRREVIADTGRNDWYDISDYQEAAADFAKSKNHSAENAQRIFKKNGFDMSAEQAQKVVDLLESGKSLKTDYFEAKPRRIVRPNEWKQAYVPNTTDPNLIQRLKDMGVEVIEYDKNIPGDRQAKMNGEGGTQRYQFSKGISPQMETEYDTAVENNDMDTAQRLVEEAATNSGAYKGKNGMAREFYHGTNNDDFTEFDPSYIASASGDTGYFGKGFYFAFDEREAKYYGKNVIKAYLNIKNPFNYIKEFATYKGKRTSDYNAGFAVEYLNLADKFPSIAEKEKIRVARKGSDEYEYISAKQFAEEYKSIIENKKFEVQEIDGNYGKEYWAFADRESIPYEVDGKTMYYDDWGYQKRYLDEKDANDQLMNAYYYLAENVYDDIDLHNFTYVILENNDEFTDELKKRGYDGVIQSEEGDEIVAFTSEQIKNSDPVTYDDDGNVIPLSERFDYSKKDRRYSIGIADSTGKALSPGQREFYKDSKAVDENGNLLRLYHGTTSAGFTVFNMFRDGWKVGENGEWEKTQFFQPIQLTTSKADADSYGGNDYERESGFEKGRVFEEGMPTEYRASITARDILKKPSAYSKEEVFRMIQATNVDNNASEDMSKRKLMSILKDIANNNNIKNVTIASDIRNDTNATYEVYANIKNPYVVDYKGARASNIYDIEKARKEGYDGVISHNTRVGRYGELGTVVIAFSPEQVKLTTNTNPTSNKDIRYSMGLKPEQTVRLKSGKIPAKVGKIIQKTYDAFDEGYSNDMEQFGVAYEDVADEFLEAANEVATNGEISKETMDRLRDILYYGVENVYEPGERGKDVYEQIKDILKTHPLSNSAIGQKYVDYGADGKKHMTRLHKGMTQGTLNDIRRNGIRFKNGGYDLGELENVFKEAGLGQYFDERTFSDLEDFNKTLSDLQLTLQNQTHKSYDMAEFAEETEESFNQFFDETMKQFVEDVSGKQMSDQAAEVIDSLDVSDEEFNKFVKRDPISPRALENITKHKKELVDTAPEWIPNYDIIREKHPEFTDLEMNDALFEILSEGTISESTAWRIKEDMLRRNSVQTNNEADQSIKELVDDSLDYFAADAAYKMNKKAMNSVANKANTIIRSFTGQQSNMGEGALDSYEQMEGLVKARKMAEKRRAKIRAKNQDTIKKLLLLGKDSGNFWATIEQNIDKIAGTNTELKQDLQDLLLLPKFISQARMVEFQQKYQKRLYDIMDETGIYEGSAESAAAQYLMEGFTEDDAPYTLKDAMEQFPDSWEKIDKAAKELRKMYDEQFKELENVRKEIYGEYDAEYDLRLAKAREKANNAKKAAEEIKRKLSEKADPRLEAMLNRAEAEANKLQRQYDQMVKDKGSGDSIRRQMPLYRRNYAHHIRNKGGFFSQLRDALSDGTKVTKKDGSEVLLEKGKIPTKLSGISNTAKPLSRFSSIFMRQTGTKNYTPDAIGGMADYINKSAEVFGYDPYIEELRLIANDVRAEADGSEMSKLVNFIDNYANGIAGKTQSLDRGVRDLSDSKWMRAFRVINEAVKKNAIVGNLPTALVQFANLPNGLGVITHFGGKESVVDIARGMTQYLTDIGKDGLTESSPFMNARYFDIDTRKGNVLSRNARAFSKFLLETGDHEAAKMIWNVAYQQALRKGEVNPVMYADDLTRRAIAGREIGELPIAMENQFLKLVNPFQVETNNAYQTFKGLYRDKDIASMLAIIIGSWLMNGLYEAVIGRRPLPDVIDTALDGWDENKDEDIGTRLFNTGVRIGGEVISATPTGSLVFGMTGINENAKKAMFGDSDPTRYGTGNIGVSALTSAVSDVFKAVNKKDPRYAMNAASDLFFNYVTPGGGRQIQRSIEGLQSEGILPQYVSEYEDGKAVGGEFVNEPRYYTPSGKVGFVNDPNDIFDVITAGTFGRWATKAGKEYLENGGKYLSDQATRQLEALGGDQAAYDAVIAMRDMQGIPGVDNSKALQKRKYLEDQGLWDTFAENMDGEWGDYGLNKTVGNASEEEFNKLYSETFGNEDMKLDVASAAGMKETLDTEEKESKSSSKSKTDANLDFLAGTPYEKAAIQNLDMDEDVLQTVTDLGYDYKTIKQIDDYIDNTDSLRKDDGSAIRNTKALQMRQYYEEMGVYDDIFQYISENGLDPQDYGLNKTVMGYSDAKFESQYSKYYGGGSSSSSSSKSSGSSSSGSSRKSSGRRKSSKSKKKGFSSEEEMKAFFDQLVANIGLSSSKSSTSAINNILKKSKNLRSKKFSKRSSS